MNIRKKLLSVLAAAATLAASAAGALTLTAGAAEGVYDSAKVVWEDGLTIDSTSVKGSFGSANARHSLDLSGKKYLLFTVENPTGVEADLFFLKFQFSAGGYSIMPKLDGKFEVLADGAAAWTERVLLRDLLGLEIENGRARIRPLLAEGMKEVSVELTVGSSRYILASDEAASDAKTWIDLVDDGQVHMARFPVRG